MLVRQRVKIWMDDELTSLLHKLSLNWYDPFIDDVNLLQLRPNFFVGSYVHTAWPFLEMNFWMYNRSVVSDKLMRVSHFYV